MRQFKKMIMLLMVLALTACGGSSKDSPMDGAAGDIAPQEKYEYMEDQAPSINEGGIAQGQAESGADSPLMPDKVITTKRLSIETRDYQKTRTALNAAIQEAQGYIVYSEESSAYTVYAHFTIRIPREGQASFDAALASDSMGTITNQSTGNEDVTRTYNDMESRIKVLEEETARLSALAERAGDVKELLEIQREITRSISDRESLMSQLLTMKEKVDFVTYDLEISLVREVASRGTVQTPFSQRVANAFADSITGIKTGSQNLILFMARNWFGILVFLLVLFVLRKARGRLTLSCPIRKRIESRRAAKLKKNQGRGQEGTSDQNKPPAP